MPTFPNDIGNVIILNNQGSIVDEIKYADSWQFPLVSDTESISLERIDYNGPSLQNNFHSAVTSLYTDPWSPAQDTGRQDIKTLNIG
jgi:hypothetical protein